ncbi:helix-turn-helix transcriptional regulator [Rhizobium sp. BK379]|uniref:helix-turn-helix domain-containing protein n=1 Tax=Rhizobium sp. BK379 TaxID=2587059 RepID=UPI001607E9F3|nr:helix-turn-helix transcriptional regulator [Rhizobium sp. BK379]MBB3444235.1 transcriptional regulator with XRE-family HTH domain [Rhizobium sp. BK379]
MKAIQLKMARAAVGLGVRELAELAGVTANTITRIENGADAKQSTLDALRAVLERDVIFLSDGETTSGGVGVRLRDPA